ncbi:MAG: hypothetical protein AAB694_00120 [Patescibacteria group bacterium]
MDTNRFQQILVQSHNILVVLPKDPSFDMVAAALSLSLSLSSYGKQTSVFCSSPMVVEFNRLVGVDKVTREVGDKNLTITLRDYPATNIERVSYNIENGQMQLTIIPKAQASAPRPEQLAPSYGGMSADTVILVGVKNDEEVGEGAVTQELARVPQQIVILQEFTPGVMGRRRGALELVDPHAACVSEVVGNLLLASNLPLDEDAAGNLMAGITTATDNFAARRVRAETFELVAKLVRVRGRAGSQPQYQPVQEKTQEEPSAPQDWLGPKIYKGTTLP